MEHSCSAYKELQCSKDRKKPSDSSACWRESKLGHKEQYQRNRGTKWGREKKETKSVWGEKKHRPMKGGALTMPHRDLQQHSHLPWNELYGQRRVSASGKGAWPWELPPVQDPAYCPSFRQMQPHKKSNLVPDPLIILSISFPSFELLISASHRTFPFNRGDSCRKNLWGVWLSLLPVAELPLE